MLVDSESREECDQSQNWVLVGKAKYKTRGVKWVSNPCVRNNNNICLPLWHRMLLPTKKGTLTTCRGAASYPPLEMMNMKNEESRIDSQSMRTCSSKKQGGGWISPLWFTGLLVWIALEYHPFKTPNCKWVLLIIRDCNRQCSWNNFIWMLSDLLISFVSVTDKCYQNYGFYQCYLISNIVGSELFQLLMLLTFNISFIVVNF